MSEKHFLCMVCGNEWFQTASPDAKCPKCHPPKSIQDLVIADMEKRKEIGMKTYGTLVYKNNGRDALKDAYEEALDLCIYLKQAMEERK